MSTMSFDSANHLIFRTFYDTGNHIQLLKKSDSKGLGDGRRCFSWGEAIAFGQTALGQENSSIMTLCRK